MLYRALNEKELRDALPLVWEVFSEYEAAHDSAEGRQAFWEAIHSEEYLAQLRAYGAFEGQELIGLIAARNAGSHVALFFVKGAYHGNGIGRRLWETLLKESGAECITVHASLYALPVYQRLGFVQTDTVQDSGGIRYIPMEYRAAAFKNSGRTAEGERGCPCNPTQSVVH